MMRKPVTRFVLFVFLPLLVSTIFVATGSAMAAEPSQRPFVPVQAGYQATPPMVSRWAPDRVVVQFTSDGLTRATLPDPLDKAAAPVSRTGLASLDQALDVLQVKSLRAAFPAVQNRQMARETGTDRWYIFELTPGSDVPAAAERLARDPNVAAAHPDLRAFPATIPNDPLHSTHWGHNNNKQLGSGASHTGPGIGTIGFDANAHAAWGGPYGYGSSSVVIAILDSGVDVGHPDLNQVTGWDYGDNDNNPTDDSAEPGHGTACAGVAAAIADNALGVAGIAGGCSIMPLKVADSAGNLYFTAIDNALYYAADHGADVVSMSFGAATTSIPSTNTALTYAYNAGVTLLAATGNENAGAISYPAIHSKVVGVGAASPCGDRKRSSSNPAQVTAPVNTDPNGTTCDGEYWWGSNYGSSVKDNAGAVDVIAPTILPTTDIQGSGGYAPGDYSAYFNGTSCATPYAAGVCALIISANPTFTPNQVRAQLVGTAQDIVNVESIAGWDRYAGYGMVDAATALGEIIPPAAVADFTADATTGCLPFTVNFTDTSTGTITTRVWNFGDGNLSGNQNPSHTYVAAGVYNVSLAITSPDGDDSVLKVGYITVSEAPVVAFVASAEFVEAGNSVDFTDNSTGNPTSWLWNFGDGGTSTEQNPSHQYVTRGGKHVTLTATNDCGSSALTINFMIIVTAAPAPVAAFSQSGTGGCAPVTIDFTNESTGSVSGWSWDFGDAATDTAANPSHTYLLAGTYDVRLIATGYGSADTLTVPAAVVVGAVATASFTVSDSLVTAGVPVTFTSTATGGPTAWAWDFGDATTDTLANPSHSYAADGTYDVTLIVTNDCAADTLTLVAAVRVNGVTAVGDLQPASFGLAQNYPNPFNPSTTFVYSLEKSGHARLEVFDISGRRITTLVDADKSAGRHEVSWRPEDLPSGLYFSRLTSGTMSATKRVMLLK
jgi:PKD repeat protein